MQKPRLDRCTSGQTAWEGRGCQEAVWLGAIEGGGGGVIEEKDLKEAEMGQGGGMGLEGG